MHVLLYEHITGGGFAEKPWDTSFTAQAFAMMNTMVHALHSANYNVHLLYDKRIRKQFLPNVEKLVDVQKPDDWKDTLFNECNEVDCVFIIAPEDDMLLTKAIRIAEKSDVHIVGPNSESASLCSNKARCLSLFEDLDLEVPRYITGTLQDIQNTANDHPFPSILKETISSGATSLHYLQAYNDLIHLLNKLDSCNSRYILQEYVDGIDASVSLIVAENTVRVLSVNKQYIQKGVKGASSKYLGGECPLEHSATEAAKLVATLIAESIPGLRGYVGIDFILQRTTALPMEINPRLTVSSIGISRTVNSKVLVSMIDEKGVRNSGKFEMNGYSAFAEYSKFHPQILSIDPGDFIAIPGVISPPIQLKKNTQIIPPYLCGWGTSVDEARKDLLAIQGKIESLQYGDST